jgi:hypothetical protein
MAITTSTGQLDANLGYIIPQSGSTTWAALSGTSWTSFTSWNIAPLDPLIWVTDVQDFGRISTFNISVSARYIGELTQYEVWCSNTGEFAGEETHTVVTEGNTVIPAFTGRYVRVGAWIYRTGETTRLEELTIKLTNQSLELDLPDVQSSDLPLWTSVDSSATVAQARVLDLGRAASAVLSAQYQPHFTAPGGYYNTGYATLGYTGLGYRSTNDSFSYFEEIDYGQICQPAIVRKTVYSNSLTNGVGTAFVLQDQNGDYIDQTVDVRVRVLPEQFMQNGQLSAR